MGKAPGERENCERAIRRREARHSRGKAGKLDGAAGARGAGVGRGSGEYQWQYNFIQELYARL